MTTPMNYTTVEKEMAFALREAAKKIAALEAELKIERDSLNNAAVKLAETNRAIRAALYAIETNRGDLSQNQRQALDNLRALLGAK